MRKLLSSLLLLSTFAFAAPPQPVGLPVYHPHAEALRAMFFDTHTRGGSGGSSYACCTDTGTVFQSTEQFLAPDAGFAFTGNTALSVARSANSMLLGASNLAISSALHTVTVRSDGGFAFASTTNPDGGLGDTALTRAGAGILAVGAGAGNGGTVSLASVQYRGLAQTYFVTGDFTTSGSGTALEAITGLTWTFPATTAINARVDCNLIYHQNVANVAVAFGFQDASVAPTNLAASGIQYTSATASTEGTLAASATTTATNVTSATPSAITTNWHAQLHFLIEQPSNASTSIFTIRVSTAAAADTVTVVRGSYCTLAQ